MLTKYVDSVFTPFATYDVFDRIVDDLYGKDKKRLYSYDVETKNNELILSIEIPGAKSNDLKISAEGRNIKISGKQRGKNFDYTYYLSKEYDPANAKAKLEDGILTIKFFKREEEKQKIIPIQIEL